jgi:hypothetical protein
MRLAEQPTSVLGLTRKCGAPNTDLLAEKLPPTIE